MLSTARSYHTDKNAQKPTWPWRPVTNRLVEVVKVHVHAKFHQAKCSGSAGKVKTILGLHFPGAVTNISNWACGYTMHLINYLSQMSSLAASDNSDQNVSINRITKVLTTSCCLSLAMSTPKLQNAVCILNSDVMILTGCSLQLVLLLRLS